MIHPLVLLRRICFYSMVATLLAAHRDRFSGAGAVLSRSELFLDERITPRMWLEETDRGFDDWRRDRRSAR
jgi:hypothetical protein